MASVSVYNMEGAQVGTIELSDSIFAVPVNEHLVHQAVVAQLANKRQGTQKAKTRSEVRGGGRKPWRQKGTGHARQGSIRAPQWTGGGVVFAPTPRDYSVKMNKKEKQQYIDIIKPMLTQKRFEHSLNVSEEAVKLAKKYGADTEKAELAGLLHDILKDTPPEKQLKILADFGIIMSDVELSAKKFWHAISGAVYIKHVLHIEDEDVYNAVRYHTTGRKNMTLLEKVIFIADFISKDRNYPGVEDMRKTAYKSLDKAIVEGIAFTITELAKDRAPIVPETIDAYNDAVWALRHGN